MGKKNANPKKSNQTIYAVAGAAVVAVAALIGISLYSGSQGDPAGPANPTPAAGVKSDKEYGAVRNVKGSPDAKVTVSEFNDYL